MNFSKIFIGIPFGILFSLGVILAVAWVCVFLFFTFSIRLTVLLLIWMFWLPAGKDVLFVYSESPNWEEYLKREVIPKVEHRAHLLNWSTRSQWRVWKSMPALVFQLFAGERDVNPMALCFRVGHWPEAFRFLQPLREFKHGNEEALVRVLASFYDYLGISEEDEEGPSYH